MIKESERMDQSQRYIESSTRPSIQETRSGSDVGRRGSLMPDQPPHAAATMAASDDLRYGSYGYPPAVRNRDLPVEREHRYAVPRSGDPSYGPSWSPSDQPTSDPSGRSYGDRYLINKSAPSPSYTSYDYGNAIIPPPSNVDQSRYAPGAPYPEPKQPSPAPYNRGYGDDRNPALGYTGVPTNPSTYPSTPPNARRPSRDSIPRNPNLATQYTDGLISPRPSRSKLNEYFISGDGIHREVLQHEICKYLGPEASSRPSSHNV